MFCLLFIGCLLGWVGGVFDWWVCWCWGFGWFCWWWVSGMNFGGLRYYLLFGVYVLIVWLVVVFFSVVVVWLIVVYC